MNKTRIMTILSVAGLFVGGAAPVLAASDTAAQNGTMTQEQIKSGECTNEGAKKQGNEEKIMDYVIDIRPSEDGGLVLSDLLGETKSIRGRLKEVQLLQHRILIEETDA